MSEMEERLNTALEQHDAPTLRQLLAENPVLADAIRADSLDLLHSLVEENAVEVVRVLVEQGADVNALGFNGSSPLHIAAWYGAPECAEVLLQNGADPQVRDIFGYTPLYHATRYNGIPGYGVLGVLLKRGAKLDILTAIRLNQTHIVEAMLTTLPNIIHTDPNGEDLLSVAVSEGNIDLVRALVENGADVNRSRYFDLPILLAVSYPTSASKEIIKYLRANGADPHTKSVPAKMSALEQAQAHAPELVSVLSANS